MVKEFGEYLWGCHCGCGNPVYERIYYRPNGWVSRKSRPKMLAGHGYPRDLVSGKKIAAEIQRIKTQRGMSWDDMSRLLGYAPSNKSLCTIVHRWEKTDIIERAIAIRILRRLAGIPTEPTAYERNLAIRPDIRRAS